MSVDINATLARIEQCLARIDDAVVEVEAEVGRLREMGAQPSEPLPPLQPPPPAVTWRHVWTEDWQQLNVGGWQRIEQRQAPAGMDDPGAGLWSWFGVPANGWSMIGDRGHVAASAGILSISSPQTVGQGVALLSQRRFQRAKGVHATCSVELMPAPGAWVGLTLYVGEGNYREIGLAWMDGRLVATLHAPRYYQVLDASPGPGGHRLGIEYLPGGGWRLLLDEVVIYTEAPGYRNNALQADPCVAIFAVNLEVEAKRMEKGEVVARVGPVVVYEGP